MAGPLDSSYQSERDRSERLAGSLARLERACKATLRGLALAVETKDDCGGGHLHRVSRYGMLLTALVAPEHTHDPQFEYGFLLHDIGELMVPDFVRNKPGTLTDAEWAAMRAHPENGRLALEGIDFLAGAREIVHCHHERWDGNGYPRGPKGDRDPAWSSHFSCVRRLRRHDQRAPVPGRHAARRGPRTAAARLWRPILARSS